MKKIVMVGPAYPYRGGNVLFVSHLYELLKEKYDVKVYNYKVLYPSFLFPGTSQYDKSDTQIKKVPNERLVNSMNPFNWFSVARKLKKENADLIIFNWWQPYFGPCHFTISYLLKNKYKGRMISFLENFISHEENPVDSVLTKIGLANQDGYMTLSEKVKEDVAAVYPEKPVYRSELPPYDCYTGGKESQGKTEFGFSPDDKVLLFFGYIRNYKGVDVLLRSMPALIQYDSKIKLLIVGESYEDISIYTSLIKELKLEQHVKLINLFVPNEEVGKYYQIADLVILPYRSATQSGILNVAYGFSKPVLVTDVGGLKEYVQDGKTGLVVAPESPEAIVEGVKKYYALRDTVDFAKNIALWADTNLFRKIPEFIEDFLKRTGKA